MADVNPDAAAPDAPEAPAQGQVRKYPVTMADGKVRHQLILVTHAGEDGRARGVPVGWSDQQAEFAAGDLL